MAKSFAGFTPEQMGRIVPEMQGMQADEQAKFLAANPAAAARVGKMTEMAQKRIGMAYGGMVKAFNEGGSAQQTALDKAQQNFADAQAKLQEAMAASQANPEDEALAKAVQTAQTAVNSASAAVQSAQAAQTTTDVPTGSEALSTAINDPMSGVTKPDVQKFSEEEKQAGQIDPTTGQVTTPTPKATQTTAETTAPVEEPEVKEAATYEPLPATADVKDVLARLEAATGKPSAEALVEAQSMDPAQLAQLGLSAAQLTEAQTVQAPDPRELQDGELIEGSTVDMGKVKAETNFAAATGTPSSEATVQGQLTGLMEQFEGSEPPAWAAGAMRAAAAKMAARGLSASSMAGQAAIQAAMESALPIAQMDAQTTAAFERQNLSNKQQAAMFAAEKRAQFLNLEFTQEFQTRVANAAKISDIANMNFTAEQQVALENARLAQSVDLANLNAANAKVLADAAAMTQMDMANLNNRQQAQVQNAKAFLDMDMASLNNQQATAVFKAQQLNNALLSDAAAENAAKQFNAASENQTNQFFSNLQAQVAQFNNEQANTMARFNAGEANAITQFNATQQAAREQFNATNQLVVAQANAKWLQTITTAENAAQNQANRDAALAANDLTEVAYNNILQMERDTIGYAFRAGESQLQRELEITLQGMRNAMQEAEIQASIDKSRGAGWGNIFSVVTEGLMRHYFPGK